MFAFLKRRKPRPIDRMGPITEIDRMTYAAWEEAIRVGLMPRRTSVQENRENWDRMERIVRAAIAAK